MTPPALGALLGLPAGTECASFLGIDQFSDILSVCVEGVGMPPRNEDGTAAAVTLNCREERVDGRRRIFLFWGHAPEEEWLVRDEPMPEIIA